MTASASFCPHCGTRFDPRHAFCSACGTARPDHSTPDPGDGSTDTTQDRGAVTTAHAGGAGPRQFGRYRVGRELGRGGFGTVYLAHDPATGDPYAVKVLDRFSGGETREAARVRLHREAHAMAAVDSPFCVRVREVIDTAHTLALVTEYIEGPTLRRVLRDHGRLTGPQALTALDGALRGLDAVHRGGLVHGDLKPDNILLATDGRSRLIDFGLVAPPRPATPTAWIPTGSPGYLSPEHLTTAPVDARSDLYAFGVLLHELLTGQRPFTGSVESVYHQHLHSEPRDPRLLVPDLGDELAALCLRSLAKDPDRRPQTAHEALALLDRAATARYGHDWRERAALGAVAASVIGAAGAGGAVLGGLGAGAGAGAGASAGAGAVGTGAVGTTTAVTSGTGTVAGGSVATKVAAVVVAAAVAGGGGYAATQVLGGDDGDENASRSRIPSLLSEPSTTFTVQARDILPGGEFTWLNSESEDETGASLEGFPGIVVADVVNWRDEDSVGVIAGIDTATGEVRWRLAQDEATPSCWSVLDDSRLLCRGPESEGLRLVDPADGSIVASSDETITVAAVESDSDSIWMAGWRDYESPRVTIVRLTADLATAWTQEVDAGQTDFYAPDLGVDDGALTLYTYPTTWEFAAADGAARGTREEQTRLLGDGYRETAAGDGGMHVVDRDGREVLGSSVDAWAWGDTVDGLLGRGVAVWDLASGEQIWTGEPDEYGSVYARLVSRDLVLSASPGGSELTAHDPVRGTSLWAHPKANLDTAIVTDEAVVTTTGADRTATAVGLHRSTGEVAWSVEVPRLGGFDVESDTGLVAAGPSPDVGDPAATPSAFAVAGSRTLFVISGFGTRPLASDVSDSPPPSPEPSGDTTTYSTACGSEPVFTPVSAIDTPDGVEITYEVTATCEGGQWITDSQYRVPFVADRLTYADGYFDFSAGPQWVPADGAATVVLRYPSAVMPSSAATLQDAIDRDDRTGTVVTVPCEPGPDSSAAAPPASPDGEGTLPPVTADDSLTEVPEDPDADALSILRRIAAEDYAAVEALEWTTQLTSKRPGTTDRRRLWSDYEAILRHVRFKQKQFPGSLLAWSGDWPGSYLPESRDYWVMYSGISRSTKEAALSWCYEQGLPANDCYAKIPRRTGDPATSFLHQPD